MNSRTQLQYRRIAPHDIGGWAVFVVVIAVTCMLWLHIRTMIDDSARKRFDDMAIAQRGILIDRMKDYEQILLGAAGLFASSQSVERAEWREYIDSLRLHLTLPGIQGVGYSQMILAKDKALHEAKIRAEGFPNYAITPTGEREIYSSIIYLEPFTGRNLRAFGYDMYSEPVRHKAMQRAADTQEPAWSDKVTLVQEDGNTKPQPGFLVYAPIYAKNKPLRTIDERRAALIGFVYSPFRAWDMMDQIYQDPNRLFELQLYSGQPTDANLLYETAVPEADAVFQVDLPVDIGGARWTARFSSNANFNREALGRLPLLLFVAAIGLECLLFATFVLDARHRRRVELATRELEQSNREISLLGSLTQLLQNCNREDEVFPILNRVMSELFPEAIGGCYLLNHLETQLELVSRWGKGHFTLLEFFTPDACWAYRRAQKHVFGDAFGTEMRCEHVPHTVDRYLCIPLLAQEKVIGDLYLTESEPGVPGYIVFEHYSQLLISVADTLSLSLSNLRLRNSLRDLSIRDSLTGLYNRRYMEESLERELERAQRQGHEVAVVMLDVDHFKLLNDTYGHEAGDTMLKRISDQMKHFRSGSDVVCRYGGEEFVLILPDMTFEALKLRLEALRRDIEQMQVNFEGHILPIVTVSIGVARFPLDGLEPAELIRLADSAMYRAKQSGRNRIEFTD